MSGGRKRDDIESGHLYRVVQRPAGSDEPWEHSNYGSYGRPRTYMTLSAARSQRTRFEREHARHREFRGGSPVLEFGVQKAPVDNWQDVV